ncbi:MAG: hypothetical protein LBP51_03910 [Deferribacteraceae bacterium]|jgi:hypothetical protein|nr:hypothetical protein [Deferribacteraceae bacterium]
MPEFQRFSEAVGWLVRWADEELPAAISAVLSAKTSAESAAELAQTAKEEALKSPYMTDFQDIGDADMHIEGESYTEGWSNTPAASGFLRTVVCSTNLQKRRQQFFADDGDVFSRIKGEQWSLWRQSNV